MGMTDTNDNFTKSEQVKIYSRWKDYNLKERLLHGIYSVGFEEPSFIQKTAIAPLIEKRDIRAQAQSGTGKTGAFSVGCLQRIDENKPVTQALVLVSTREMAEQNATRMGHMAVHFNIKIPFVAGGHDTSIDINNLSKNPPIVVGTPGRVLHMIKDGHLKTDNIELLVIDEADEMMKRGFIEQVHEIYESISSNSLQVAAFSATWEEEDLVSIKNVLQNPVVIDLKQQQLTLKGLRQYYIDFTEAGTHRINIEKSKLSVLLDIYKSLNISQSIIFVNLKRKANSIASSLGAAGIPCSVIHSDLNQAERSKVIAELRTGKCRTLVATGLVGRGIDIQQLSLVINFDVPRPDQKSTYIHRIGRAGRYGRKGVAINLADHEEMQTLNEIMAHYNTNMLPMPNDLNSIFN